VNDGGPLRVLVVDDEELARAVAREQLRTLADVVVVGECANGFEAVKAVSDLDPDVLLLDVQMPKLDGFEVLELLDREVAVVFVTAHDEHAVRAFEVHAVDYVLKPFNAERLGEALERARRRGQIGAERGRQLARAARPTQRALDRVLIRDGAQVHVIPAGGIDSIEAQDDYVCIRAQGRKHLKQQTLAELEQQLDPQRFVRVHRSWIVNVERLARLETYAKDSRVAILHDGSRVPVSRTGYARLRLLL
jgi:two-component system LytT family response regulator